MKVYKLDTIYRQAEASPIIQNSIRVNAERTDLIENEHFKVFRYTFEQNEFVARSAVNTMINRFGYDINSNPFACQILSPIKKELIGVNHINKIAQQILNPSEAKGRLRVKDKIIFIKNNYKEGYFNGDIGIIEEINPEYYKINVQGDILEIPKECDEDIQLAYAITIHKSQGSEYNNVIIILPQNGILKTNLIYTAISRAKENVIILSEQDALEKGIKRNVRDKRNSGLIDIFKDTY